MAITKSDIPSLLLPGLKTEFDLAYRQRVDNGIALQLATLITTTIPSQKYAWLGNTPVMREFLDERRPTGLNEYNYTIEDKTFEASIAVDRKAIEDDQYDLIRLRIRDLAERVAEHQHKIVVEALANGFTALGYDGVSFFNSAHTTSPGSTYSNRTNVALDATSLANAINNMMLVPDERGEPLGIVPDTLLVGPKLQWTASELVESPVVVYKGNTTDTSPSTPYKNVFEGKLRLIVSPYLRGTFDDYWFVLDTTRAVRAIILQQRSDVPVEFSALDNSGQSDSSWWHDRFYYGVRARYNVGYGLWQTAYGSIL
ncbi:MAG TPA: Mu-like prophage major head subunit gpT family protein [Fimbriimonadales bacterium]|nr:Mu-like prophage major head subunit gpT family protein [Fimbriimonadales bacterium]